MASLKPKLETNVCKFNWDDIEVGDDQLNHSENFFAQKHFKHEKFDELELINEQFASAGLDDADKMFTDNICHAENKENSSPLPNQKQSQPTIKVTKVTPPENASKNLLKVPKAAPLQTKNSAKKCEEPNHALDTTAQVSKPPPNIACQWSTQKPVVTKKTMTSSATGASAKHISAPPHAYEFKDLYEKKKQEALRRREEEERKMRQFHSRPVPNFAAYHQQQEMKPVVHAVTVAVTPMVLKKSKETDEKRRKKLEEWKRQNQPRKFEPREPNVLKEEPFVPKKTQTTVQQRPFNLNLERRLHERKQYNEAKHRAIEEKHKQVQNEEEERKKREEERIRELRKLTTFKARQNPFNKHIKENK